MKEKKKNLEANKRMKEYNFKPGIICHPKYSYWKIHKHNFVNNVVNTTQAETSTCQHATSSGSRTVT